MTPGVLVFLGAIAVCVAQTDCTFGSYDLSSIGTQSLSIPQTYKGQTTTHTWVFNFCSPVNQPPPNTATACSGAGYVSEYSAVTQPKCEMYWPSEMSSMGLFEYVQLNYTGGQSMNPLWTAVVNLNCDSGAGALSSTGPVVVTATPGTNVLQFVFSLSTAALCPGVMLTPHASVVLIVCATVGGLAVIVMAALGIVWWRRRSMSAAARVRGERCSLIMVSSSEKDVASVVRVRDM